MVELGVLLLFIVGTMAYCITPERKLDRLPYWTKFVLLLIYATVFAWLVLTERGS
jgi:hypothetical protein